VKLIEAMEILRRPVTSTASNIKVYLACGFMPLHLRTFLAAFLQEEFSDRRVQVTSGLFGDLAGNLERLDATEIEAIVVCIEWSDLDARLGVRTLGGWRPGDLDDIVISSRKAAMRLQTAIAAAAEHVRTTVCMPTLPLPPLFTTRPEQASSFETELREIVASTAENLSRSTGVCIASDQLIGIASPLADRYDVTADLTSGFPYTLGHASAVARVLAGLIRKLPTFKGLITDLDDTLWGGIVGDDGVDGISWDLDHHTQMHGLYQQFLASLAGAGVLIGVASKNDADPVEQAFAREDILLSKDDVFPFEIHWSPKSESVQRILKTWNIGADSVIFVDDSPIEVAEVKAAFPSMDCRLFPKDDYRSIWNLLVDLRRAFGKPQITTEDRVRLQSIRNASEWRDQSTLSKGSSDEFLRSADAHIAFESIHAGEKGRAFELVNKTNQFNLNGRRFSESEWSKFFLDPAAFGFTATYKDKFGPLGTIAVLLGNQRGGQLLLQGWVMSCRAFSRRIEYQCLKYVFENFGVGEIALAYEATQRNGPMQEFLTTVLEQDPALDISLSRDEFFSRLPPLFHEVKVAVHD
jgi:FkbH-like protein